MTVAEQLTWPDVAMWLGLFAFLAFVTWLFER